MIGKRIKNQIERAIQQKIGINPDAKRIRRLENEVRALRGLKGKVLNLEKNSHSRQVLIERDGKYYLEEESA